MTKISIGCDHAGFRMKEHLKAHLALKNYEITDRGCFSEDSVDYPDLAHLVAADVEENPGVIGILLCGSANGVSMAANKHKGIRAAICWNVEIAELARRHNDANILSLPARFITEEEAFKICDKFLNTEFEGGRHEGRVTKIHHY